LPVDYTGESRSFHIFYKLSLPIQAKKEYLVFDSPSGPGRLISKEGAIEDVLKLLDF
jgi:hypothetical protein